MSDPLTGEVVNYFPAVAAPLNNPYSTAITLAPLSSTYDAQGNVATMTVPMAGQYTNFTRDQEGSPTSFNAYMPYVTSSPYPTETINYTSRGEVQQTQFTSGDNKALWYPFATQYANGFQVLSNRTANGFDSRSGMLTRSARSLDTFGDTVDYTYGYDGAGRQSTSTAKVYYINPTGHDTTSYTRLYDNENHIVQTNATPVPGNIETQTYPFVANGSCGDGATFGQYPTSLSYGWGPDGHILTWSSTPYGGSTVNSTVHWDGGDILFTSQNGSVDTLFVSKLAQLGVSGSTITLGSINDRNWTGSRVSSHSPDAGTGSYNPYQFGAWQPADPLHQWQPNGCANTHNNPNLMHHPTAPRSDQSGSPKNPSSLGFSAPSLDGWSDGINSFQGVRTYDPSMGQWTSPDAYAGNVHDPMSQKPFMYNRNNTYEYSDPSGNCIEDLCVGEVAAGSILLRFGPAIANQAATLGTAALSIASSLGFRLLNSPLTTRLVTVANSRLANALNGMFKAQDEVEGGTAGALRYEAATGNWLSATGHLTKATQLIKNLTTTLKSEPLTPAERTLTQALIDDLKDAVNAAESAGSKYWSSAGGADDPLMGAVPNKPY